jgi:hypothetical protein
LGGSGAGFGAAGGGAGCATGGGGGGGAGFATGGGAGFSACVAHPAAATARATKSAVLILTWFLLSDFSYATSAVEFKHSEAPLDKRFFERKPMLA